MSVCVGGGGVFNFESTYLKLESPATFFSFYLYIYTRFISFQASVNGCVFI